MSESAANRPTLGAAASASVGVTAVRSAAGFGSGILLARVLGPEGRGELAYVMAIVAALVLLSNLGVSNALVEAHSRAVPVRVLYSAATWVGLGAGLVAVTIFLAVYVVASQELLAGLRVSSLLWAIAVVPPTLALQHWTSVGYIEGHFVRYGLLAASPGLVFLGCFGGWALVGSPQTDDAIALWASSLLVPVVLLARPVRFATGPGVRAAIRRIVRFGLRANLATLALVLTWRVDVFMIGAIRGTEELGYYAVAVSLAEVALVAGNAVRSALGPAQARSERRGELSETLALVVRIGLIVGLVLCLTTVIVGDQLIVVLFGDTFAAAAPALTWLLPGVVLLSLQGPIYDYLLTEGHLRAATTAASVGLVANVVLNLMLLPRYGFVAASVASTVAYFVSSVLVLSTFRRVADLRYGDLFILRSSDRTLLRERL